MEIVSLWCKRGSNADKGDRISFINESVARSSRKCVNLVRSLEKWFQTNDRDSGVEWKAQKNTSEKY